MVTCDDLSFGTVVLRGTLKLEQRGLPLKNGWLDGWKMIWLPCRDFPYFQVRTAVSFRGRVGRWQRTKIPGVKQ